MMVNNKEEADALGLTDLFVLKGGFMSKAKGGLVFSNKELFHNLYVYLKSIKEKNGLCLGSMLCADATFKIVNNGWGLITIGFNVVRWVKSKGKYQVRECPSPPPRHDEMVENEEKSLRGTEPTTNTYPDASTEPVPPHRLLPCVL